MPDMMSFPETVEEFMDSYKIVDTKGIYMSKGAEMVPIFRMKQWFEHISSAQPEIIKCKDCRWCDENITPDGSEIYWICKNWVDVTDVDGFCHDAERIENG